jgi:hypothetical protein
MRSGIIFDPLNIRAVGRQYSLANKAGIQRDAPRTDLPAVSVNRAETGVLIQLFTWNIGVKNLSVEFDFFEAAAPAAPAFLFPGKLLSHPLPPDGL